MNPIWLRSLSPHMRPNMTRPLVKVVSEAIARDHKRRVLENGGERSIGTFIQSVHVFLEEGMEKEDKPPAEKIVVFDEAQHAWDAAQSQKKHQREISEPEMMLKIMDRHP